MRYKTRLIINLNLFAKNFERVKKLAPKNEILYIVKANAYGHGLVPMVRFAVQELGIKEIGCASLGEALEVRESLPELDVIPYVLSDLGLSSLSSARAYVEKKILPVVHNFADLDFILSQSDFRYIPLCLKFNTGMNRLGFSLDDMDLLVAKLKQHQRKIIHHMVSHLACGSSSIKLENNLLQLSRFKQIKKRLQDEGFSVERSSLANSGAVEQGFALDETHVRPGIMLYGVSSLNKETRQGVWQGEPISTLETYVLRSFEIKKGTPVSYGATPCPEDGILAIIAIGYGDGFSTRYNGVSLKVGEHIGKVVGRVNMDMANVLFPREAKSELTSGRILKIWDHSQTEILNLAEQVATVPYELFCQLSIRLPRIYTFK
ncbi:MAG: alanine racemase [Bacteriovoracaceae bacterium]|nr:alanine racemase [Bacteriovoracaceae bacterium]